MARGMNPLGITTDGIVPCGTAAWQRLDFAAQARINVQ
jgi:hypothetical protein